MLADWLSSTDHKVIGHLYLITSFGFFMIGGLLAMIMRAQLMGPDNHLVSDQQYNELFTMHGAIMLLLFATPLFVGFANEIMPPLNDISSIGSFILGASTFIFLYNIYRTWKFGERVTADDPWGFANSLEWATSCPPPRHNFTSIPRIRSERPAFDLHYPQIKTGRTPRGSDKSPPRHLPGQGSPARDITGCRPDGGDADAGEQLAGR